MDLDEYKEMTARREYIPGGSPAHELMHGMSAEAQKITSRINCGYHTQEELRGRLSKGDTVLFLNDLPDMYI